MLTEDHSRQDLGEIRDLAKRLAMSFGIDLHRVRKPLVALHTQVTHMSLTNTYRPALSGYHAVYSILILLFYLLTAVRAVFWPLWAAIAQCV